MSEARVWAPPMAWGPWQTLWTRFGVVGPDADRHRSVLNITYESVSQAPSTFDIQIDDGERMHQKIGPGRHRVVILGNVAAEVRVRCKSHLLGQSIRVRV